MPTKSICDPMNMYIDTDSYIPEAYVNRGYLEELSSLTNSTQPAKPEMPSLDQHLAESTVHPRSLAHQSQTRLEDVEQLS